MQTKDAKAISRVERRFTTLALLVAIGEEQQQGTADEPGLARNTIDHRYLRLELLSKIYYFILELVVPMDIPIVE